MSTPDNKKLLDNINNTIIENVNRIINALNKGKDDKIEMMEKITLNDIAPPVISRNYEPNIKEAIKNKFIINEKINGFIISELGKSVFGIVDENEIANFLELIKSQNMLISGSFILWCYMTFMEMNITWKYNDIDMYFSTSQERENMKITLEKYGYVDSKKLTTPPPIMNKYRTEEIANIDVITMMKENFNNVQLIMVKWVADNSYYSLDMLKNFIKYDFDLTCCAIIFEAENGLLQSYSFYDLKMTDEMKMTIIHAIGNKKYQQSRIDKYKNRGFAIIENEKKVDELKLIPHQPKLKIISLEDVDEKADETTQKPIQDMPIPSAPPLQIDELPQQDISVIPQSVPAMPIISNNVAEVLANNAETSAHSIENLHDAFQIMQAKYAKLFDEFILLRIEHKATMQKVGQIVGKLNEISVIASNIGK